MSDDGKKDLEQVSDMIIQLADSAMSDTMGLHMQNAVTTQQGMQTVANASTSTACALILKKGG
ncbi:RebB family R body protein [Vibrio penaeicida]|uniref:RebB family R body protein n=1 Tax=Vibrio penaeicida TaxID=104609 RepID=UPI000CE9B698|nr:RebB family R body protein [Vibrio penaeicida]